MHLNYADGMIFRHLSDTFRMHDMVHLFTRLAAFIVALAVVLPGWAADQSAQWLTAESGLWSDPTFWSTNPLVPNQGNGGFNFNVVIDAEGNPYIVTVDQATTLESFTLDSADATLWIDAQFRASSILINQGTVHLNHGTIVNSSVINHDLIVVDQQTLRLGLPWANHGVIRLINGGSLAISGANGFANLGLIDRIDGSVSWIDTVENVGGVINLDAFGGDVYLEGTIINGGEIRSDSGYQLLTAPYTETQVTLNNVNLGVDVKVDRSHTLTVQRNLTLSGGSRLSVVREIEFRNNSLLDNVLQGDGQLVFDSEPGWDYLARIEMQRGLVIGEGIAVRTGSGGVIFTNPNFSASPVTNYGQILATTAPIIFERNLINHGLIHASGEGIIEVLGDWVNHGVVLVDGGTFIAPTLDLTTGTFNFVSGTLSVESITGNLVNDGGILAPGNSPGITVIDGDYTQGTGGKLAIELAGLIAGETFDQVLVTGTVTLDGLLNVTLLDDFVPDASDTFIIIEAAAINGHFANAWDRVFFHGGVFDVTYTDTQVILSNYAIPEPSTLALLVLGAMVMARPRRRSDKSSIFEGLCLSR